ncbi:MAG: serine/threonine protein kinase, partial [Deltaproteobacteria bacterium]|nr:serine/threonine protein kinase [Deltaproteobacteria bacterium]MBW2534293.1 serine/threonine protein kinase [Deltaproteobacteria bacterium]
MEFSPGTLVTPNVRLTRLLGEGGMGSVWVGDHLTLETQVAVKFILPELSQDDPEILARFRREAKLAARIKSQHVVRVFDHGVMGDDTPFIVMELLEGSSLADWLDLQGNLTLDETAEMVNQVASVLAKAHEIGVVHRDIKPENVFLVDSEDRLFVKVLDFGIAKQTRVPKGSLQTGIGVLVGTPMYMSPEQLLRAGGVDFHADLWALSVVAYRAVTGLEPFSGETVPAIIVAITEGEFDPPSAVASQPVPPSLDRWFRRALARNASERFSSARELAESFRAAATGTYGSSEAAQTAGGATAAGRSAALVTSPTVPAPGDRPAGQMGEQGGRAAERRPPPPPKPKPR